MKKVSTAVTAALISCLIFGPVFAEEMQPASCGFTMVVNGNTVNPDIPAHSPYKDGDTVMIPLRAVGEALGYTVSWDADTEEITVDDCYIQKAVLKEGTNTAEFIGRLKIINMSRKTENSAKTVIYDGCTFVPADFFKEFMNDVVTDGTTISVSPSMCELAD